MTKTKAFMVAVALAAGGYTTYRWQASDTPAQAMKPASDTLVQDRLWIDHLPRNDRDTIQVFIALTQQPIGGFQTASQWTGKYELFRYEKSGGEIRAVFPQTGSRETIKAKVSKCDGGWMDYCLELSGSSHGVKRYYSREDWVIGSLPDAKQLAATLESAR